MLKNKKKLEKFTQILENNSFALMEYRNLDVSDMEKLRKKARENECKLFVVKNTLSSRLLPELKTLCKNNTLFAIGNDSLSALNTCMEFKNNLTPLCVSDRRSLITKGCESLVHMRNIKDMYIKLILTLRHPMTKLLRICQMNLDNKK